MGMDVFGPSMHVCIEDVDGGLLDLAQKSSGFPCLGNLSQRYYDSFTVPPSAVSILRDELIRLEEIYRETRSAQLAKQKKIRASDAEVFRSIVDTLLNRDLLYQQIVTFKSLCDEAIAEGQSIRCEGD